MVWFAWILIVGVVIVFVRQATGGVWRLHFVEGELQKTQGKIAAPVLAALRRVAVERQISGIVSMHGQDQLKFSAGLPESERQRFRNVYFSVK